MIHRPRNNTSASHAPATNLAMESKRNGQSINMRLSNAAIRVLPNPRPIPFIHTANNEPSHITNFSKEEAAK